MVLSCIMEMYVSYNEYVQGRNQEFFMAVEVLAKKGHNICKIRNTLTFMIKVLICLFR